MQQRNIVIRNAVPTVDDGLAFARYLDQAAEGFFRFMLGRGCSEVIAQAFLQPGHDLSYEHVIFAERDDSLVGMASGYSAEQHRRSSERPLREAAGFRVIRMAAVALLCWPLLRFLDTLAEGDFYLQAVAVDGAFRGQGIGSALIDAVEERARDCGAARFTLDVSTTNNAAQKLYENRGMAVVSTSPGVLFFTNLRAMRMTKRL